MHLRLIILAFLCGVLPAREAQASAGLDTPAVQQAYETNNRDEQPLLSWMERGQAKFLLYADGLILVEDRRFKSRLGMARLTQSELDAALKIVLAQSDFWLLASHYELTKGSDQPLNIISVRIHGKKEARVSVYGRLDSQLENQKPTPRSFTRLLEVLAGLVPAKLSAWDPGYVEILWADYDYAPDHSLPWPKEWPGFDSPLTRPMKNEVINRIMIFPSSRLPALDAFLASRPVKGAILIDGVKMSANYLWPLPGEKKWTPWNQ